MTPHEIHRSSRTGWLRAAALDASCASVSIGAIRVTFWDAPGMSLNGVAGIIFGVTA